MPPNQCGFRLFELYASAELEDACAYAALFRGLREHDQRNAEIQCFIGAVHAAMSEEHIGDLQDGNLIHMRICLNILGKHA